MSYQNDRLQRKLGIAPPLPTKKERKPIKKQSDKKAAAVAAEREARDGADTEMQKFFKSAVKQMTGRCIETGEPTEKKIFKFAINSVCHLLSQQHCPSVKSHPCNWIELQQDFHKKFDAMSWEEREKLKCWPIIRDKLVMVYPDLAPAERRHFPDSVLQYIEQNEPF